MSSLARSPVLLARGLLACSAAGLLVAAWSSTSGVLRVAGLVAALTLVVGAAGVRAAAPHIGPGGASCPTRDPADGPGGAPTPGASAVVQPVDDADHAPTRAGTTGRGVRPAATGGTTGRTPPVGDSVGVGVCSAVGEQGRTGLLLGHTPAGAAVVAGGTDVTVVGRGALARSVHGALCAALAERCGDGDELRALGRVDDVAADRLTRTVSAAPDDARCRDLGVAIVSLVGADGVRRGAVQLVPESLRPRRTPVVVEVGAVRCTAALGDGPPVTITPLLPTVLA